MTRVYDVAAAVALAVAMLGCLLWGGKWAIRRRDAMDGLVSAPAVGVGAAQRSLLARCWPAIAVLALAPVALLTLPSLESSTISTVRLVAIAVFSGGLVAGTAWFAWRLLFPRWIARSAVIGPDVIKPPRDIEFASFLKRFLEEHEKRGDPSTELTSEELAAYEQVDALREKLRASDALAVARRRTATGKE